MIRWSDTRSATATHSSIWCMTGNVALNDGPNVTRGEKLIYNTTTGVANVQGGRVQGLFVPNSADANKTDAAKPGAKPAQPAPKPTN